jgi:peptidoglycan biosynthesis protein MviN/MurJ (putative lipid II flippase)
MKRYASADSVQKASAFLATLSVAGSLVGFAYDSVVVATLGPGPVTDAYFLALGVVSFLPTLYYLAATNVVTPILATTTEPRAGDMRAAIASWSVVGLMCGAVLILARTPLSVALSNDPRVQRHVRDCLTVLSSIPLISAFSEFQRARLLAAARYRATGLYVMGRNLGMAVAALFLWPRSAVDLAICVAVGYGVQLIVIQWFHPGRTASRANEAVVARPERLVRAALVGLVTQGLIFSVGYLPVLAERGIAARLGSGFPTIFSYCYRIVSMFGSVAITSATIPGVAELSRQIQRRASHQLGGTLRQVFDAAAGLAWPAAVSLVAIAVPAGWFLAPRQATDLSLILALYGLSLVGWTLIRPWNALEYARGASSAVLLVTAVQSVTSIVVGLLSLRFGPEVLALGPLSGAGAGVAAMWLLSRDGDWDLIRACARLSPSWIARWLGTAGAAAACGMIAIAWRSDRTTALLATLGTSAVLVLLGWKVGLLRGLGLIHSARPSSHTKKGEE